jgi:hypothetical protein
MLTRGVTMLTTLTSPWSGGQGGRGDNGAARGDGHLDRDDRPDHLPVMAAAMGGPSAAVADIIHHLVGHAGQSRQVWRFAARRSSQWRRLLSVRLSENRTTSFDLRDILLGCNRRYSLTSPRSMTSPPGFAHSTA